MTNDPTTVVRATNPQEYGQASQSYPGPLLDPKRCTLIIPNDLAFLPLAQTFVRDYVAWVGFPPEEQARFDLLLEEEVTNVVQGAFAPDERAHFDISCERVPAGVQITVHDEGLPFDPTLTPDYDPHADLDRQTTHGLGSFLLRSFADRVEFNNLGSRGKETVIVKYLEAASVADAGPPAPAVSLEPPEAVPRSEWEEIAIGSMAPHQAVQVARCIYDAYRYTYVNEHMYYPERIQALNEAGTIVSAVATTTSGEVAGHAALVFSDDDPGVADLALAATKAQFRGQSISRRLGEFLDELAVERGLAGLYIEEVTVHTFTQRFCHRLGYVDCGFLLAYSPVTTFKGINEDPRSRGSVIVGFKYLTPPPQRPLRLDAPARHRDVIAGLYQGLETPVEFSAAAATAGAAHGPAAATAGAPGDAPHAGAPATAPDEPVLMTTINPRRSVAVIRIPAYGAPGVHQLRLRLRQELYRVLREDVRAVVVFLNMLWPGTAAVAEMLEDLGFLFTGVRPGGDAAQWLLYEYFHGVVVDYDAIQVESPATRSLLNYIRGNDPHVAGL